MNPTRIKKEFAVYLIEYMIVGKENMTVFKWIAQFPTEPEAMKFAEQQLKLWPNAITIAPVFTKK